MRILVLPLFVCMFCCLLWYSHLWKMPPLFQEGINILPPIAPVPSHFLTLFYRRQPPTFRRRLPSVKECDSGIAAPNPHPNVPQIRILSVPSLCIGKRAVPIILHAAPRLD